MLKIKKPQLLLRLFYLKNGAEEKTRTSTGEPPLDPEPSVSTNSTTSALRECIYKDSQEIASCF